MPETTSSAPRVLREGTTTNRSTTRWVSRLANTAPRARLSTLGWFGAFAWLLGTVNRYVSIMLGVDLHGIEVAGDVATGFGVVISLLVGLLMSSPRVPDRFVEPVGFVFALASATIVELIFVGVPLPDMPMRAVPWSVLLTVFFPIFLNWQSRTAVVWAITIAFLPTLVLLASPLFGGTVPPRWDLLQWALGPFYASLFAVIPVVLFDVVRQQAIRALARAQDLGSYRLDSRLGRGGMGEVWRAEHRLLARPVALKIIRTEAIADEGRRDEIEGRFFEEARATAELSSPHTISLFDFGLSPDGSMYYVMELLNGLDLDSLVRTHGPLQPRRLVNVLVQVCESLEEAHERKLVHRDIKPANVMLCRIGARWDFVKVLDFGIVRRVEASAQATAVGVVIGTPHYLAPEATGAGTVDAKADQYSLGCLAWFCLTGSPPFDGETAMDVLVAHRVEPLPPCPPACPAGLEEILRRLLTKAPKDRFSSMRELRLALEALDLDPWTAADAQAWWEERGPTIPIADETVETWRFATGVRFED